MQLILLSGGSGKRLWPLSDNTRSKQFIPILEREDGESESMIQRVCRQIRDAGLDAELTLATNASQEALIHAQLGPEVSVVTEPERRDTFPAIALAASYLALEKKCADDEIVVVMPCDPYTETGYFETIVKMAECVSEDVAELVLMGISPTCPSSKYGYVVPAGGGVTNSGVEYRNVARFTEKPTEQVAEGLLAEGAFWNGGVFAFRLGRMMQIVRKYIREESFACTRARYGEFPKISFDYEVAEKAGSVAVVPFAGEWKDLGTWNTLTDELSRHEIGNCLLGPECENVHVINESALPVFVDGLKDVVVAVCDDGILVCSKDRTEHIKDFVVKLQKK